MAYVYYLCFNAFSLQRLGYFVKSDESVALAFGATVDK